MHGSADLGRSHGNASLSAACATVHPRRRTDRKPPATLGATLPALMDPAPSSEVSRICSGVALLAARWCAVSSGAAGVPFGPLARIV